MGYFFKTAMFITSFAPLWITVLFIDVSAMIQNKKVNSPECIGFMAILLLNILCIIVVLTSLKGITPERYRPYIVLEATQERGFSSEFLLSYVLPLFVFDFTQWNSIVQFLIYFCILAFLCVRNNNVYVNLLFELMGYKFYTCMLQWAAETGTPPQQCIVISRDNLTSEKGNTIKAASLNKPFYLGTV